MLRTVFAFLLGVVAMVATVAGLQTLGHWIWPPPSGIDMADKAQMAGFVDAMPLTAKVWILITYATAVEIGAIVSVLVDRPRWRGLSIALGVLMTVLCAVNFWLIPHPVWMVVVGLLLPVPVALAAGWWLRPQGAGAR